MKHRLFFTVIVFLFAIAVTRAQQNVGIGTATPDASALLDLSSNSKGFLIPRLTVAQKNSLITPASGLLIYITDSVAGVYYRYV